MKKTLTLAASLTALTFLTGCAGVASVPVGDRSYSESNSRAYNLATAGGLREARDTKLSEDEYSSMMSDLSSGAGTALSLSSSAGFGLSGGASLGLGLASALLSGPGMMGFDSAFAFVPESMASNPSEASEVITDAFFEAVKQGSSEDGYTLRVNDDSFGYRYSSRRDLDSFTFVNEDLGCSDPDNDNMDQLSAEFHCVFGLIYPTETRRLTNTPLAVRDSAGAKSYPVLAHDNTRALQVVVKFSKNAEQYLGEERLAQERVAVMQTISENMPPWFFIYEPSKAHTPPMIISNGEIELFVTKK